MYLSHFGLNEPPFRITPHTEFFYDGANRGPTLEALLYAVTHDEGIVKVTGEVGSGKTMLCRVLLERLPKTVETIYLANPSLSRDEILRAIAEDLRMDVRGKRTTLLLRALQEHLIGHYAEGRRVVVLIDEAHAMPPETLEEIRLLSNLESNRHKLLQIVLFGQPELDDHLNLPNMRQLRERITHSFKLEPLVRSDIENYIDFRMRAAGYRGRTAFTTGAIKAIASASEGLTRRVNILSDKALLAAFADNSPEVGSSHARAAIRDSGFRPIARRPTSRWIALAATAVGVCIGLGIPYLMKPAPAPAPSPPTEPVGARMSTEPPPRPTAVGTHSPAVPGDSPDAPPQASPRPSDSPPEPPAASPPHPEPREGPEAAEVRNPPTSPPSNSIIIDDTTLQALPGPMVQERYIATLAWLQTAPASAYSIQLLTAREPETQGLENFLRRAKELVNPDLIYVYSWKTNGKHNFRVSYGQYETIQASREAIDKLPTLLRSFRPFPESIAVLRSVSAS